ncbi:hypothetical protein [Clostridium magnum]|uniref:PD(D/E)XK endonuclease domain-containing protein n=1 Tax=Clostridium magnum DSM 2767 TaxID=1121326 RepID=A0A162UJ73_9CLOT|nr:hypothetical protein [Clostridium magnum]KZL93980.1 hypothetical protein CLMAG_10330 [Clostridium magnum DSM 2767]SHH99762.1 hypothetical protein SAMN02745944_02057 [Clostridium magnum DSM 2767]
MDSGIIGEYYTLCELWRNNYKAIKSNNPIQDGWDIIVLLENKNVKLQVKTINWKLSSSKVINGDFQGDFDFLVVVLLEFNHKKYTTLIIPKCKLKERPKSQPRGIMDEGGNFLYTNETMTWKTLDYIKHKSIFKVYKDNWDQVTE